MEEWRVVTPGGTFVFTSLSDAIAWIASTQPATAVMLRVSITHFGPPYGVPGGAPIPPAPSPTPTWTQTQVGHTKVARGQ